MEQISNEAKESIRVAFVLDSLVDQFKEFKDAIVNSMEAHFKQDNENFKSITTRLDSLEDDRIKLFSQIKTIIIMGGAFVTALHLLIDYYSKK